MKIVFTIVIGLAVLVAALVFLTSSICAVGRGLSAPDRVTSGVIALVSLGVTIGGAYLIAYINRKKEPLE
jgi:hypothetical protein